MGRSCTTHCVAYHVLPACGRPPNHLAGTTVECVFFADGFAWSSLLLTGEKVGVVLQRQLHYLC